MIPDQNIWYHVVTVGGLIFFKLAVLVVGYLIARLGHDLLIKGVTGQFKFHTEIQGSKADLVSASPGIFFILMATVLIAVGVIKDKPFETRVTTTTLESGGEHTLKPASTDSKPVMRDLPTNEAKP
jgi:hypothetical protein